MPFLTLDDLLLPPPLAAAVAVSLCAGIWWVGDRLSELVWGRPSPVERAAGLALAVGIAAGVVHALSLAQSIPLWLLRSLAVPLAGLGIWRGYVFLKSSPELLRAGLGVSGRVNRLDVWLSGTMVATLFLAALGPATDADSLDYHLGVPLDWIREGGAFARTDWLHARLVGLGESINLLGLGAGTDSLGAVVQFAGLIIAWRAILGLCRDERSRVLSSLLVLTFPLLLFLVPSQKPQMFPAAAIVVSLILLAGKPTLSRRDLAVVMAVLASAVASKYSMLLTGGVVVLYALYRAWRHRMVGFASVSLIASLALFAGPVYLRNFAFYGDPLSPFLERFLPDGETKITTFAIYLRGFGGGIGLERFLKIPMEWLFSPNLLVGSNVFGIGLLGFLTLKKCTRACAVFLGCALGMLCLQLLFAQVTSRFFLEGFLLICAAVAATPWNKRKLLLQRVLTVQTCLTAAMAVYTAALLFPGGLSEAHRHRVMSKAAFHYQASRWLDEVLPEDVVLLADMRTNALLPRPFRSNTEFAYVARDQYLDGLAKLARSDDRVVLARYYYPEYPFRELESCSWRLVSAPREFDYASRNPLFLRTMTPYSLVVEELDPDKPGCPWAGSASE